VKINDSFNFSCRIDRCQACEYPVFENLVDDQWYRIVVPSFLMNGGDGYYIFKDKSRNHKIGVLDIDYFIKYVTKISPIFTGTEGRITIIKS